MATCYLVLKIQDSPRTLSHRVEKFLKDTQCVWSKVEHTNLDEMVYRLPRMECILFAGIDFDLQLDIPHNYVNRMCKKAFDLPPTKVDEIFERTKSTTGKSQNVSECIRYFLLYW